MNNKERMVKGMLYHDNDPEILKNQRPLQDKMQEYNKCLPSETKKKQEIMKEIFAEVGEDCTVETPINSNWGCAHVHLGNGVYINSNVTFVDDDHIYIGDHTLLGPNIILDTATHPIDPELRMKRYEYNLPIHIGKNVWLGAGVIVLPGVTIGDNSVIGAGSVVTKDIPANVVAYGVPCKVVREIGEHDKVYYYKDRKIDDEVLNSED